MMAVSETPQASEVPAAKPGEFSALQLGRHRLWPPTVLAPMAGVTNAPFRTLCRRFGAGLCISEMVTVRPLVEGNPKTWRLATFVEGEFPRSQQLYGVDPYWVGEAVKRLLDEDRVDHLDLNFGCPVRKVTRLGGGAALPHRPRLLARIVTAAVAAAGTIPVSIKFRMGIDDEHLNYLDTGRIAQDCGCVAVTLHARTAAQGYEGAARWTAISALKDHLSINVLGNGDVWEAADAIRMMRSTHCDGVVVGRGCLGRPWLFDDLSRMYSGQRPAPAPSLGVVVDLMLEHATLLSKWSGEGPGMRAFRKHATWYTKGFPSSALLRERLTRVDSLAELHHLLAGVDREVQFPKVALRAPRAKSSRNGTLALPPGYLQDPDAVEPPADETYADGG